MNNESYQVETSTTKTPSSCNPNAKQHKYKHPGSVAKSGHPIFEDVDQYFSCPDCGGTIDNYSCHCIKCKKSYNIYNENKCDKEATKEIRKDLVRIDPWTGEIWKSKKEKS